MTLWDLNVQIGQVLEKLYSMDTRRAICVYASMLVPQSQEPLCYRCNFSGRY